MDEVQSTRDYKKYPAWGMDVCVVHRPVKTKDKMQDNQDKEKNTDEVQRE